MLLALGCTETAPAPPDPDDFLLGGIQINEPDLETWHRSLRDHGFNTVALTVYARQQEWSSAEINYDAAALEGGTVDEMRAARRNGLHSVLILRVALEHALPTNRFLWHGLIQPQTDQALDLWFERYGEFVLAWAEVAEREGVDVLGIGSELSSLSSTRPVERLPGLERWYLDLEAQERERDRALGARGDSLESHHLKGGWGETFDRAEDFFDRRSAAQADWARQVTGGGDLDHINARRRQLDRHWRALIARVREVYSGDLTYAANFDQYQEVGFWDALDILGVNAYFPLRSQIDDDEEAAALLSAFEASWREILGEIDELRRARGIPRQPVLFTEVGYTRRRGATVEPWAGGGFTVLDGEAPSSGGTETADETELAEPARLVAWDRQPYAPVERAMAIRALRRAATEVAPDMLHGLLWWKLSTVPSHRDIESFLVLLTDEGPEDPVLPELRAFLDTGSRAAP